MYTAIERKFGSKQSTTRSQLSAATLHLASGLHTESREQTPHSHGMAKSSPPPEQSTSVGLLDADDVPTALDAEVDTAVAASAPPDAVDELWSSAPPIPPAPPVDAALVASTIVAANDSSPPTPPSLSLDEADGSILM